MRDKPHASLVWDGGDDVRLPPELGQPREDQFVGTPLERLCEVAGRTCYDSFGSGRSSGAYHAHLLEVNHLSVHEHAVVTLQFDFVRGGAAGRVRRFFANRPGCWVRVCAQDVARVTMNLRSVLEWDGWSGLCGDYDHSILDSRECGGLVRSTTKSLIPVVWMHHLSQLPRFTCDVSGLLGATCHVVPPETEDEEWVSLFMGGSRGFSHEQVRHGDFSAISQRSTRYVDETASAWVTHPLLAAWLRESQGKNTLAFEHVVEMTEHVVKQSRKCYETLTDLLQRWLEGRGTNPLNSRKQARGAARGFLGNALYTEMVFTASVRQWKRMITQRASVFADAEIRECYAPHVLTALKQSRYAGRFDGYELADSSDGIGQVVTAP